MADCPYPPDQTRYTATRGKEHLLIPLPGGPPRVRKDQWAQTGGQPAVWDHVVCQWSLDPFRFNRFQTFYEELLDAGSGEFNVDLTLRNGGRTTHVAFFTPDTFALVRQDGWTFVIQAELEVRPLSVTPGTPAIAQFPLVPEQDGFSVQKGTTTLMTQLSGGAPQMRKDHPGTWASVHCVFYCDADEYSAAQEFIETTADGGSLPFTISLYMQRGDTLTTHLAFLVPGTFRLSHQEGEQYLVEADLYADPTPLAPDSPPTDLPFDFGTLP